MLCHPCVLGGPLQKTTETNVAQIKTQVLHHACVLGGPQTRGQSQSWPISGQKCYITPVFSGVPQQRDGNKSGPEKGGSATSPLRSPGSRNKVIKSKGAHKWAEVRHHPSVLGVPYRRGMKEKWPTKRRKCHVTAAFSGVPKQRDKVKGSRQVGGIATSPLSSRLSPTVGDGNKSGPQKGTKAT